MGNKSKSNIKGNVQVHIKAVDCGFKADSKDSYVPILLSLFCMTFGIMKEKCSSLAPPRGIFYKTQRV